MQLVNLAGKQFGRLMVLGRGPSRLSGKRYRVRWICLCICGTRKLVSAEMLSDGRTRSCGCLRSELMRASRLKHGHARSPSLNKEESPTYRSWYAMIQRCTNHNSVKWPRYGGRGITVCLKWRNSFQRFLADMGERPTAAYSIDRINNDGNYEPSNCRWATAKEQAANKRRAN